MTITSHFCILVSKCSIKEDKPLINYFMDGLDRKLTQLASKYITPENKQEIWGKKKPSNFQQVTRVILGEMISKLVIFLVKYPGKDL